MSYDKLFARGRIGGLELKNRVVLPPMGTSMASWTGEATDEIIRFYAERAKGGCGLIITEITRVDDITGVGMTGQLSVTSGKFVRKLVQLTDAVHQYDSKVFLQLHHPGREISSRALGGVQPVAPSAIACKVVGEVPHELTEAECEDLIRKFVTGASFAKLAGFDGVELHAAHGYLINEFLSPYTNKRTDRFGGDTEGRMTFIREIIQGIQKVCGPRFPISVRLSCDEYVPGGIDSAESVRIAKALEALGVAAIDVSAGIYESGYASIEPQGLPEGWKKHLAAAVKANVSIPVIAVNNIKYPATAEQYLNEGVCDFVAIGRGQLADPEWSLKAQTGREDEIRKCLGCMHCFNCLGKLHPIECTVNPIVGREGRFNPDTLRRDGAGRTVVVVGGGPAGMHAAWICAQRGYRTVLTERSGALGGSVRLAAVPPHKEMLAELIRTQTRELALAGVEVLLNTEATVERVAEFKPYGVIVAAGGSPIVPGLPGIRLPHVCTAEDYLAGRVELTGKKVAVIGGGVTGLETAEVLAAAGNEVTVVEMAKAVGATLYATVRLLLLGRLQAAGVHILTEEKLLEVTESAVRLSNVKTGAETALEADAVVLAMGVKPDRTAADSLLDAFDHVTLVGDVSQTGQIADAMRAANDKAYIF